MAKGSTKDGASIRKKTKNRSPVLDLTAFSAGALCDEVSRELAICSLETHLKNPAVNKEHVWSRIVEIRGLFALVVNGLSADAFKNLHDFLLDAFPANPQEFPGCFVSTVLRELSVYLSSLPPTSDTFSFDVANCHQQVASVPEILQILSPLCITAEFDSSSAEQAASHKAKRKAQRTQKHNEPARMPTIDFARLSQLEVSSPASRADALAKSHEALEGQKNILKRYLQMLRREELSGAIQGAYVSEVPQDTTVAGEMNGHGDMGPMRQDSSLDLSVPFLSANGEPLKRALEFANADGFGGWRILLGQRAERDLREEYNKDFNGYTIIMKKLCELSNGHFSPDNQKRLVGSGKCNPVFEAKTTRDTRIIYQVDCIREMGSDVEKQALRVYGIYTHAQIHGSRFWGGIARISASAGKEYISRCKFRRKAEHAGDYVHEPMTWTLNNATRERECVELPDMTGWTMEDKQELQHFLVSEKFVPFTQALVNSIVTNTDVNHPFHLSPVEQSIVSHPGTCFVLGRSGTGKTTTMVFKMIAVERMWRKDKELRPRPRQIFITQSAVLAQKMKEYYWKTFATLETEALDSHDRELNAAEVLNGEPMLEESPGLLDQAEENKQRSELPKSFRELRDEHFPLFVPYYTLCRLLEAAFDEDDDGTRQQDGRVSEEDADAKVTSNEYMMQQRQSFVSYSTFLESYWNHFPKHHVGNLDSASVFAEFMGVIRGSEGALSSEKGCLDKATYCGLSPRVTALGRHKGAVYSLFETYMKMKAQRREYDAADRAHAIIRRFREKAFPGETVDNVYVDEVQDNLLIDTWVIRKLCKDPAALFWAGDTAQTISVGSSFRFNELKAFMYRLESSSSRHNPGSFQLTRNYRSHGGIIRCAQSILDAITHLWPYSIDILQEEKGLIDGPKPLFISGKVPDFGAFLSDCDGTPMEFGHQQCILVRNDVTRAALRENYGSLGLILTLYESKGLEFEDVVLYNFFADSTVTEAQWRVVLNCLPDDVDVKRPRFDDAKHHGVCHELKSLYVAMTRARVNLWIIDYTASGDPVRDLWTHKGHAGIWEAGAELPRLAHSSSPDQWEDTANRLAERENYNEAKLAYERAGRPQRAALMEAQLLRQAAKKAEDSQRSTMFVKAAEAFRRASEDTVDEGERSKGFHLAAECYLQARDRMNTAKCLELAKEWKSAAKTFEAADAFEDVVRIAKGHGDELGPSVAKDMIELIALIYLANNSMTHFKELFNSPADAATFAGLYGYIGVKAELLEESHSYHEATFAYLELGDAGRGLLMYNRVPGNRQCADRLALHLVDVYWDMESLGNFDPKDSKRESHVAFVESLLKRETFTPQPALRHVLFVPVVLRTGSRKEIIDHGRKLLDIERTAGLLCLDYVFHDIRHVELTSVTELVEIAQAFHEYISLMATLVHIPTPCDDEDLGKLLGFRHTHGDVFLIMRGSILQEAMGNDAAYTGNRVIQRQQLAQLVKKALRAHCALRLADQGFACKRVQALRDCLQFSIEGRCTSQDCRRTHMTSHDAQAYNDRVYFHFLQLRVLQSSRGILQTSRGIDALSSRLTQQRFWLARLFEALYPASTHLGSAHVTGRNCITPIAARAAAACIAEDLFNLKPGRDAAPYFMSNVIRDCLLNWVVERQYIPAYFCRLPAVASPPDFLRRTADPRTSIIRDLEHLLMSREDALVKGLFMLTHLIEQKIPLEIGLLCELLDIFCCMLVVASGAWENADSKYVCVLPRSWGSRLSGQPRSYLSGSGGWRLLWAYPSLMSVLLEDVYSEAAYLGLNADASHFHRKSVYIARICRNLGILAINSQDTTFHHRVMQAISRLVRPDRLPFPAIYDRFAADDWRSFRDILYENALGGQADPLLSYQLEDPRTNLDSANGDVTVALPPAPSPGVRFQIATAPGVSNSEASAASLSPRAKKFLWDAPDGWAEPLRHNRAVAASAGPDHRHDSEAPVVDERRTGNNWLLGYSADELRKLRRVLRIFRRTRLGRKERNMPDITSRSIAREIKAFAADEATIDANALPAYRRIFWWSIPHVLVSLRGISETLQGLRMAAIQELLYITTEDKRSHLSKAKKTIDILKMLRDRTDKIIDLLQPQAHIHHSMDSQAIRTVVADIKSLRDALPDAHLQSWLKLVDLQPWFKVLDLGLRGLIKEVEDAS